jgi:RNA polymerase-binding protein DksA
MRAAFRGRLLERQHRILTNMSVADSLPDRHAQLDSADDLDRALDALDQELDLRVQEIRSEEIQKVEEALERVEAGTYGKCAGCGARISAARLRLIPEATLCVHCQQESERERAQEESGAWDGELPSLPSDDSAMHRTIRATVGSKL